MDVIKSIQEAIFGFLLSLDGIVYSLITWVYQIIMILAESSSKLFSNTDLLDNFMNRLYVIIGVVMMFFLAYSLLRSMVNPDELTKGKKSPVKIIKDVIISIALIAFVPTIFEYAYNFQSAVLSQNTIGKIILGNNAGTSDGSVTSTSSIIDQGGNTFASALLGGFIHPKIGEGACGYENGEYKCNNSIKVDGVEFNEFWKNLETTGDFGSISSLNTLVVDGKIDYMWLISTIAGVLTLLILVGYCFDTALRMVKLAVFQLIAPIPILCRVAPGEQGGKVFSNWVKGTLSTYLEVFIRMAILFFAVFIITVVISNLGSIFVSGADTVTEDPTKILLFLIAKVLMILGIILFVKQAPQIIKEITGLDGGKYSPLKSAKQAFSFFGGGIAGAMAGGGVLGALRGSYNAYNEAGEAKKLTDFHSIGNQYKRSQAAREAREIQEDNGLRGIRRVATNVDNSMRRTFGFATLKERADRRLENFQDLNGNYFTVTNDTGAAIMAENGRDVVLGAGDTMTLTPEARANLERLKASRERAKAQISEQARQAEDATKVNQAAIQAVKDIEALAESEIETKNKVNLVTRDESSGLYHFLELTAQKKVRNADGTEGNVTVTFGGDGKTLQQYRDWLEAMKSDLAPEAYEDLKTQVDRAQREDTKRFFIDNNGRGQVIKSDGSTVTYGEENEELKHKKQMLMTEYDRSKLKHVTRNADGSVATTDATATSLTGKNSDALTIADLKAYKKAAETENFTADTVKGQIQAEVATQDIQIKGINRVIEQQPKEQVAQHKASTEYRQVEAADRAHNINKQGGNGGH